MTVRALEGGAAGALAGANAILDIPAGGSVAWDELDGVLSAQGSPWDPAARIIGAARNLDINLALASKVPGIVPAHVRAAWDVLCYVPWAEPRYLEWLTEQDLPTDPLPRFSFHAAFWREGEIETMQVRNDSAGDVALLLSRGR